MLYLPDRRQRRRVDLSASFRSSATDRINDRQKARFTMLNTNIATNDSMFILGELSIFELVQCYQPSEQAIRDAVDYSLANGNAGCFDAELLQRYMEDGLGAISGEELLFIIAKCWKIIRLRDAMPREGSDGEWLLAERTSAAVAAASAAADAEWKRMAARPQSATRPDWLQHEPQPFGSEENEGSTVH
jgi:hypothetical protein